ncbi:hypothetical protein [uncultured Tenacibaculum sp.]|uniref:hypothetical protein n=1 Tax=uncultured Tenacibaculum sp. TaxID=174713 RepID=UPI00261CE7DA|nr:hypothetical protein [uncultured Tenacibaculum sp.]
MEKEKISGFETIDSIKLYNFLTLNLPDLVTYKDLYNLCLSLFCSLDILPDHLRNLKIDKDILAIIFNKISKKNNWAEEIDSFLKLENNFPDHEKAKLLIGMD